MGDRIKRPRTMKQAQQKMGRHKKGKKHPCDRANAQVKHDTAQAERKAKKRSEKEPTGPATGVSEQRREALVNEVRALVQ